MSRPRPRTDAPRCRARSRRPRVESLERRDLMAVFVVNSNGDSGPGTLRDAITQSNATPVASGGNLIVFDIADSNRTIALQSALPIISRTVSIDGQSQPGYNGAPAITISGSAIPGANGLTFTAGGNVIRGLAVNGFAVGGAGGGGGQAINLLGVGGNLLQNNCIGVDASATVAVPNRIGVYVGSPNNIIGGDTPIARNFISGNNGAGARDGAGILLEGPVAGNAIQGNYIGLNASGESTLPNAYGILFGQVSNGFAGVGNTIGGTVLGAGNFISGNTLDGIALNGSSGGLIIGNYIGLNADANPAGNLGNGISQLVATGSTQAVALPYFIGVNVQGAGNLIWNNGKAGIAVANAGGGAVTGMNIQGNSFTGNAGPAIDIGNDGTTPGYLFVTAATRDVNGNTVVSGVYHGAPNTPYNVDLFASTAYAADGYGQGDQFLSTVQITTDILGNATFTQPYTGVSQPIFSATVTDPAGSTSEFSLAFPLATGIPTSDLSLVLAGPATTVTSGSDLTITATVTNNGGSAATGVLFNDQLPAGLFFISGTASNGAALTTDGSGLVRANLGTIPARGLVTVSMVVNATQTGSLTNAAAVFGATFDTNYANNQSTQTVTILPPVRPTSDLGIAQVSFSPSGSKVVGQQLAYTISVTNFGPSPATGVTVTDFVPNGQRYVDASSSQGASSFANGILTTNLGSLAVGATATVTVLLNLTQSGAATNVANVQGSQLDTNAANNSSTLVDSISGAAATQPLTVTQVASPASGTIGQPQTITITVTNPNTVAAPGVILTDTPPTNGGAVTATTTQGSLSIFQGSVVANLGTIAAGGSAAVVLTLTPTSNAPLVNSVATIASGVPGAVFTYSTQSFPVGGAVGAGPTVLGIAAPGSGPNLNRVAITFSSPLNSRTATRPANYRVLARGVSNNQTVALPVRSVAYNSQTRTATVTLSRAVPIAQNFRIVVVGATANGIRDTSGNRLVGSGGVGTNYVAEVSGNSLPRS